MPKHKHHQSSILSFFAPAGTSNNTRTPKRVNAVNVNGGTGKGLSLRKVYGSGKKGNNGGGGSGSGEGSPVSVGLEEVDDEVMVAALDEAESEFGGGNVKKVLFGKSGNGNAVSSPDLNGFKRGLDVKEVATPVSMRKKRRGSIEDSDDEDNEVMDVDEVKPMKLPKCTVAFESADDEDTAVDALRGGSRREGGMDGKSRKMSGGLDDFTFGSDATVEGNKKARKSLVGALDGCDVNGGTKVGPSWAEKHPWTIDVRDKNKKTPGEQGYDKTTLFVPASEFAPGKTGLTPFQKQFWKIKKDNYDVVIFFKKGKFYEMYDKDADVGHHVLNLNFTKGGRVDMRCCGVPEQSFDKHVTRLIEMGYKVGRVEQTETINAVKKRKAASRAKGPAVCERSLVRILTKSTVTDENMLKDHKARYLLAIKEDLIQTADEKEDDCVIGVCYIDAASGLITIGEYDDDYRRSSTEKLFTYLSAPEIIVDSSSRGAMSDRLRNLVRWMSDADEMQVVERPNGFPPMTPSWLQEYLGDDNADMKSKRLELDSFFTKHSLASQCFGAAASYLTSLRIDKQVLSMGNYTIMPPPRSKRSDERIDKASSSDGNLSTIAQKDSIELSPTLIQKPANSKYDPTEPQRSAMAMDASTLTNLEVVVSSTDGSTRGTLLSYIDHGKTAGGRRLLRKWLSSPLYNSEAIIDRLNAVECFLGLPRELLLKCQRLLAVAPDLSRALAKIHSYAVSENRAVMFDDSHNRKVKAFVKLLRGLESILKAVETLREEVASMKLAENKIPRRLRHLLSFGGGAPEDIKDSLMFFFNDAFDFDAAESQGEIHPRRGVVPSFDNAQDAVEEVKDNLEGELKRWKTYFKNNSIKYYHRGKEPYQLEVPLTALDRYGVPESFTLKSTSKGAQRYWTGRIQTLVEKYVDSTEVYDRESETVTRAMFGLFAEDSNTWDAVSSSTAEIDALMSLALTSEGSSMVRPDILLNSSSDPVLRVEQLRHPILSLKNPSFIPNDTLLGGPSSAEDDGNGDESKEKSTIETTLIITGPNMGGKSTLSRQVALSAILAQIGCFVPAESMALRPLDAIFVRMGACDRISRGRSTFMVELEETSAIIERATSQSLVILDELGRGTSTHDGYAIAHATLNYLLGVGSLVLFSTHYTSLATEFKDRREVGTYEMQIAEDESKGEDGILFLYRLGRGVAKYSRGISCARMAGIPRDVCVHAETMGKVLEQTMTEKSVENEFVKCLSKLQVA